jgi:hypothetical protein
MEAIASAIDPMRFEADHGWKLKECNRGEGYELIFLTWGSQGTTLHRNGVAAGAQKGSPRSLSIQTSQHYDCLTDGYSHMVKGILV